MWSAYKSRRSRQKSEAAELEARNQVKLATEAAQDAAAAQNQIAGETKRLADVAEQQSDAAERRPWDITPDGGSGCYRLINKRDTPKYDVRLSGDRVNHSRTNQFRVIDGGGSVSIYLLDSAQVVNRKVKVTWRPKHDPSGERWPQVLEP